MAYPNKLGHYRDGYYRVKVKNLSTGSTAMYHPSPDESGTVFVCGTVSTVSIGLPKISSKWLGLEYTIYFSTADDPGDYTIQCAHDSSAGVYLALSSAGVGTPSTIVPATTDCPHAIKVTAISSVIWLGEPISCNGYTTVAKTLAAGAWTTG